MNIVTHIDDLNQALCAAAGAGWEVGRVEGGYHNAATNERQSVERSTGEAGSAAETIKLEIYLIRGKRL